MKHKPTDNKIILKVKKGDGVLVLTQDGVVQIPALPTGPASIMLRMAAFMLTSDSPEVEKTRQEILRLYVQFVTEKQDANHTAQEA